MNITQEIKKGAFWVLLFSVIGGPIALFRNWLFTQYDPTGTYVADFALVMVLFNVITTFFVFGGNSVLTNFVPKIDLKESRSSFLVSYFGISTILFTLLILILLVYPPSIAFLTNDRIGVEQNIYIILLAIPVILSQILIYFLQGSLDYKTSSFLSQVPNFLNTCVVIVLLLFHIPMENIVFQDSLIIFLSFILFLGSLLVVLWGLYSLRKHLSFKNIRFYVPKGFWMFSFHVHLLTLITFLYQNFDQVFILKVIGLKELGYYFIIIQLVETVRFIPLKIGQVLLASFSKLVYIGDKNLIVHTYNKVGRIVILINLILSVLLVLFGIYILRFFNIEGNIYYYVMVLLVFGYNVGCIGNLNSMVILANNLSRQFLFNNLLMLITQIGGLFLMINNGFIGVGIAKVISIIIVQIGLFYIVNKHISKEIGINKNYYFSQIVLFIVSCIVFLIDLNFYITLLLFAILVLLIFKYYNFSIKEFILLVKTKNEK